MHESDLTREISTALQKLWYQTKKTRDMVLCPRCRTEIYPEKGWPDLMFWDWKGPAGFIETKVFPPPTHGGWARTSFSLSKISPAQRAWFIFAQETGGYHLYIGLGTVHGTAGAEKEPRLAWVVPWALWAAIEREILPIQRSLPLTLRPGLRRPIQDGNLVATNLLRRYELEWRAGGWHFGDGHPIWQARPLQYGLPPRNLKAMRERQRQIREEQKEIWQTPTH